MVEREGGGAFDIRIVEPSEPLRGGVSRAPGSLALVVTVKDAANGQLLRTLADRLDAEAAREGRAADRITEALTPEPATTLRPAQVAQLARSAEVFTSIEREFGYFSGPQVGDLADSAAGNRSATATRWRGQGRIFAISRGGTLYYPRFQFGSDGQPKQVVARVTKALGSAGESGWVVGSWFVALNTYLADDAVSARRPVDVMDRDAGAVVAAAQAALDGGP